ncbi:MAG: conjugal transfer protein TraX [Firmicutes bacterium]|nr:conjugal transfer protein TraX [Bacillota bacterium]
MRSLRLNANQLKLIAIIAMTVDHLTWTVFPGLQPAWYVVGLHVIGRLTAPIMWFFIAEGCHYTHSMGRYLARLFGFALISHFAYDFAFGIPCAPLSTGIFNQTSVMWSLAWAAAMIALCRRSDLPRWVKTGALLGASLIAFPSDWSSIAVMCPFYLYAHRGSFRLQARDIVIWSFIYAAVYFLFIDHLYGCLQMLTCLSLPLLSRYNGQRGRWRGMKWLFYIYYPAHLFLIGLLRLALHGNIATIF